jgi:hypothetical protein
MTTIVQERLVLAVASAIVVTAVIAAAVGVPGENDDASPQAAATTAPAAVSPSSTTTASPSAATTAPTAATTSAPPKTAASSISATAAPPKPGDYRYRVVSDGETTEETTRISDGGSGRQTERGEEVSSEVAWRGDGKFILETTFGQPPESFRCDWNPDVLEYKFPMAAGTSWSIKGSCSPGPGVTIEFDATSRVAGAERIAVAGQNVNTWVVRSEGTLTFRTPQETATQTITSDDRFSPEHGLSVRSTETTRGTDPETGENIDDRSSREILNLTPA